MAATSPRHSALAAYAGIQTPAQPATAPEALAAQLPVQLHAVVQQQLQALMQGQIVWQGPLWPGQNARWSVRAEPDDTAQQGEAGEMSRWTTALDLDLPRLGPIRATLQLRGDRVDLVLRRGEGAGGIVDAALPALRTALHGAGLTLGAVEVGATDAAPG